MEIILISSNAKYYPDFHDNRDMKTFNTKLIVPFIITLLLTGCMPDSLTKFKKDAPTKASATTTTGTVGTPEPSGPVVDNTGTVVAFTHPTLFHIGTKNQLNSFIAGTPTAITDQSMTIDGTLATNLASTFILSCSVVSTLNPQSAALPSGLVLSSQCKISGNPTVSKSVVTPFCSDPTYTNQTACESAPFVWNSATSTCINHNEFQYNTSDTCTAGTNTWYGVGAQIPYKIELRYRDSSGAVFKIYATIRIGTYLPNPKLLYSHSDKLLLPINPSPYIDSIVPVRTVKSVTPSLYSNSNIIADSNGVLGVVNFVDNSQNTIGVRRLIKMTLANASSFAAGQYITTSGNVKIGKIFKKDTSNTNVIYVENISDGEIYFTKADSIDNVYPFVSTKTTITAIDEFAQFSQTTGPSLDNDRQFYQSKFTLANNPVETYLINSTTAIKPIAPISTIKDNNGTIFTVSPKLPSGLSINPLTGVITGKFLNPLTQTFYVITAANPVNTQSITMKIAASNAPADLSLSTKQIITVSSTAFFTEGETLFQQIVPPLASAPEGKILKIFSNSHQMAIETTEGAFLAGASLDSGTSTFYSEKAYIIPDKSCVDNNYTSQDDCEIVGNSVWSTGPVYYNLGLKLSATSNDFAIGACSDPTYLTQDTCEEPRAIWDESAGIDANGDGLVDGLCSDLTYVTQNTCEEPHGAWGPSYVTVVTGTNVGAKAIIAGIYKNALNDTLYVRHLTQAAAGVATAKTFYQGDTVSGVSGLTIVEIDSGTIKMGLTDTTNFLVGKDVTSTASPAFTSTQAGGYIYSRSTALVPGVISVSDISHAPGVNLFRKDDHLYNDEFTTTAGVTIQNINSLTHDIHIIAEARKPLSLNTSISTTNVTYSIIPNLPAGLSLNTRTGKISGTPTTITPKKDFLLSATNFTGQTTYAFSLEVRDYFSLKETSGAPSFLMHKIGDTQVDRKCRINASDIINSVSALDVRCNLEAQEEDLYFNPIKLQALVGPGVCQYVSYTPYWFWSYAPKQSTTGTSAAYPVVATVKQGCATGGTIPTADKCDGNYNSLVKPKAPNCDEGHLDYTLETWGMDSAPTPACTVITSSVTVSVPCGGKKVSCIEGPLKDLLGDADITTGFRAKIYQTPNGFNQTWPLSSPISHGDSSNVRVSNFTSKNLCTASNADANTWTARAAATLDTVAPYGKTSPYYVVNCLNAASQIKARIRLVVRDWDRNFKLNNGVDLINPALTTTGVATDVDGAFMDNAGTDGFGNLFNSYKDYDNMGANFTGGSCGVIGGGAQYPFPQGNL